MTNHPHPYPAYKPSGIPWLGDAPEHWEVQRLRNTIVDCVNGVWGSDANGVDDIHCVRVADFDRPCLRVRTPIPTVRAVTASESRGRMLTPGDLLLEKSGGGDQQPVGVVILFDHSVPAVSSNFIARMSVSEGSDPKFLTFLHSSLYAIRLNTRSIKQTTGIQNLDSASYLNELVSLPPLPEQAAIVRYLDHADRRIRRYVNAKRKLIALLEEERKIATLEAIQSPNTMSRRLEVVADLVQRPIKRASDETYTPIGLYNRGRGMFRKEPRCGNDLGDSNFFWIEEGDLVISGQFAWEGAIALASDVEHGCVASHRYPILRGKSGILDSGFLLGFFQTDWGQLLLDHNSRGAAGRNRPLNARALMKETISLPPIGTQLRIAGMLQLESHVRQQARLSEQLLNEYRTRLIADVVTGKLDVREAAAQLAEEDDEVDSIDEGAIMLDNMDGGSFDESQPTEEELEIESEVTA